MRACKTYSAHRRPADMVHINLHGILYSNDPRENARMSPSRCYEKSHRRRGLIVMGLFAVPFLIGAVLLAL